MDKKQDRRIRKSLLCRLFGCHWEVLWTKLWDRPQWAIKCQWCGCRGCCPADRYDPQFGGREER